MTTVIRRGKQVICDTKYIRRIANDAIVTRTEFKFFRHPTNRALIGITGYISRKSLYDAIERDIGQIIVDMKDYPNTVPDCKFVREYYEQMDPGDNDGKDDCFGVMIVLKNWSIFFEYHNLPGYKNVFDIQSADTAMAIGSGCERAHALIEQYPEMDLLTVMENVVLCDNHTGGKIYMTTLELEEL